MTTTMTNPKKQPGPSGPPSQEDIPQERRGSYRYPVVDVPAMLGWWELPEQVADEPSTASDPGTRAGAFAGAGGAAGAATEPTIYSVLMARGPAFRKGTQALRERVSKAQRVQVAPRAETKLRSCDVWLQDISQTGMSVTSQVVPEPDRPVWVRLDGAHATVWVEVVLQGIAPLGGGVHLIRLAFRESCPYNFFKAAVYGKRKLEA